MCTSRTLKKTSFPLQKTGPSVLPVDLAGMDDILELEFIASQVNSIGLQV